MENLKRIVVHTLLFFGIFHCPLFYFLFLLKISLRMILQMFFYFKKISSLIWFVSLYELSFEFIAQCRLVRIKNWFLCHSKNSSVHSLRVVNKKIKFMQRICVKWNDTSFILSWLFWIEHIWCNYIANITSELFPFNFYLLA